MVRRLQNRGYATLARIADHLERLAVGDESNAAIDADRRGQPDDRPRRQGAGVPDRLRRQHGPRHRRRRARRFAWPPTPAARRRWRSPTTSRKPTRTRSARDREETKRLLYVALTRARDRLYLSASLVDRRCIRPTKGSLGEVSAGICRAGLFGRRWQWPAAASRAAVDAGRRLRPDSTVGASCPI